MSFSENGGRHHGLLMAWMASAAMACGSFAGSSSGGGGGEADAGDVPSPPPPGATIVDAATGDGAAERPDAEPPPLLAYWDFEEPNGATVIDRSGAGNDAKIDGDPNVIRGDGKYGHGVVFRREGSLDCPMTSLPSDGALSFWMRDDDDDDAPLRYSASYFLNQNSGYSHLLVWRDKNRAPQDLEIAFQLANDAGALFAGTHRFKPTRGVWTRVVVSWTKLEARILVGTAADVKLTFSQPWVPSLENCYFGRNAKAAFDEIRFFARSLTDAEMLAIP